MRSVYTCLMMLLCVLPAQLLQAAGADTDTTGRAAVGFTGQKHARFKENSHKKDGGKYVHVWQGGISTQALEGSLQAINKDLSANNIPAELHLVIGAVGARGKYTLLDATSADPQKELSKKELQSQEENIKKNTQAFSQWIGSAAQLDGDKALVIRLNVIVAQKWSDGVLVKRYSIEPSFSCPLRNDKPMIAEARVSLITKDLNHFARGANISDQESFDTEIGKLLKRIKNDLLGELRPSTIFALDKSIPYSQLQDKPSFKEIRNRIETGKPKEDMVLGSAGSHVYDLSDILTNTERTSLNQLLDYLNEKFKGGVGLGTLDGEVADLVHKLEEIELVITDFRMPSEQLQSLQDWMAEHAGKAVVWLHFDEDKLMYEFRAGTNRLLNKVCALEKAGLFIANVKANQLVYDLTSLYAATVNYFVPGKVTPLPPDYIAKYPFFESVRNITVPGIPETWYNPDVEAYNGIYADYLFNNDWQKFQRIFINALEEQLTGVKWPADIDTRKYSVDRQHFALVCGFLNMLPDLLNGALNLPKGAISINELLCNAELMEQLVRVLASLSQRAKDVGGYLNLAGELIDNVHINPCMASYYTGNICAMLMVSYLAVANAGKISNIATFIMELGNLDPAGMAMGLLFSPVGKFAKYAYTITTAAGKKIVPGIWNFGKYLIKFVPGKEKGTIAMLFIKKQLYEIKQGNEAVWQSFNEWLDQLSKDLGPGETNLAVTPDGQTVPVVYMNENQGGGSGGGNGSGAGNNGNGTGGSGSGNGGDNKKPGKVIRLFPEKNPDGSVPKDQLAIVDNGEGELEPAIIDNEKVVVLVRKKEWVEVAEESKNAMGDVNPEVTLKLIKDGKEAGVLRRELIDINGEPWVRYYFHDAKGTSIGEMTFKIEEISGKKVLMGQPVYEKGMETELPGVAGVALQEVTFLLKANPHALNPDPHIDEIVLALDKDLVEKNPYFKKEKGFLTDEADKMGPVSESLGENYKKGTVKKDADGREWWTYENLSAGRKEVTIKEGDRIKLASKESYVVVPLYSKGEDGQVVGKLVRLNQNGELNYFYKSEAAVEFSPSSNTNARYFTPATVNAFPNKGEGYVLIVFKFNGEELREGISSLEKEILDNIQTSFAVKKTDNLFLYWPEGHTDFQEAQQELVTRILTERYGYNKPEIRSIGDREYVVFTRPPAAPENVGRLSFTDIGSPGKAEFVLVSRKTNKPLVKISKTPVAYDRKNLTFSYTDLRVEDVVINQPISVESYTTRIYSLSHDLSPFGIDKTINVMSIDLDAMPARLEQELPGTMAAVRDEAIAYYNKNFKTIEGVVCNLEINNDNKPFDLIAYQAALDKGMTVQQAIWSTPTGVWAAKNGFTKAEVIIDEVDHTISHALFTTPEVAGDHGFGPAGGGSAGNGNIVPENTGAAGDVHGSSTTNNNDSPPASGPASVNNNNGSLTLNSREIASNAPVGSLGEEVHLPLADGSGEIVRYLQANNESYQYSYISKETNKEIPLALVGREIKLDETTGAEQIFLLIKYFGNARKQKLQITVLKEALACHKSKGIDIAGMKVTADNWTAEVTDGEILQSDIGKVISKDYPEITIKQEESRTWVYFSNGPMKGRIEVILDNSPTVRSSESYDLTVKSKETNNPVGVLSIYHTEREDITYSFFNTRRYDGIASAVVMSNSEEPPFLSFIFNLDPAIRHIAMEPQLFDKAFTEFMHDGMLFNEIRITWLKGFADANDRKAFQEALKYGANSAIYKTSVGELALEKGYTTAIVKVNEEGGINVRFLKPTQAN